MMELNANNGIKPASYEEAKAYFDWVQQKPRLSEAIDAWEILNEVNLDKYWKGTPQEYVDLVLKAAWDSFKPNGETVVGGSFTLGQATFGGTDVTEALIEAGYLDYCDYANVHPYATSVSELKTFMNKVLDLYEGKPVFIGEWNYKNDSYGSQAQWIYAINQAREYFASQPTIEMFVYYRHLESSGEGGWPGLVRGGTEYTPQIPFYNMYKNWPKTPNAENTPPSVTLTGPADGTAYTAGDAVPLEAEATDLDGTVTEVAFFYNGDQLIGIDSDGSDGWSIIWEDIPPGNFALSALAKDDGGATSGDDGISISASANTSGKVISINFRGTGSVLDTAEAAGVVARKFWNNSGNGATTGALLDENGENTGATVSNTLPSNYSSADPASTPDFKMMRGYIANFSGSTQKVSITDLPPVFADSTYDVYVYWGNQDNDNDYARYTIGDQTFYIRDNTNAWNGVHTLSNAAQAGQSVTGANFVMFKGISGRQFDLNVQAFGTYRAGISGIQIVRSDGSPQLGAISITSPEGGSSFSDGDNIPLVATTTGFGSAVNSVSFYANGSTLVGIDTTGTDTWSVDWEKVPAGIYSLTAVAANEEGIAVISFPMQTNVLGEAGDVISINFKGNGPELSANEVAGVVPATNWNNANYNTSPLLVDADGNNTGATVSTNIPSAYSSGDPTSSGDFRMMKGFIANFASGTKTIAIENLPESFGNQVYDVYVYASNLNNTNVALGLDLNEDVYFLRDNTATWDGSHDRSTARTLQEASSGPNYVLFEGVTGTSFTLNVTSYLSGSGRIGISGIQIVKSNRASSVILSPSTGEVYTKGETINLEAEAINFPDSSSAEKVAFYYDEDELIGEDTDGSDGWSLEWEIPNARSYDIFALASSADGTEGKSLPVNIRVKPARLENVISVNFKGTGSLLTPSDTAGAAPVPNWNNTFNNLSTNGLVNAAGDTTEAFIVNNIPANYQSFDDESNADFKMMKGYVANFDGTTKELTVGNLPASFINHGYSVFVYWGNKDTDNDVVSYTLENKTYSIRDNDERWDGLHSRSVAVSQNLAKSGANYVLFDDLKDSSFTIQIQAFNTFRGGISGMQIIANAPLDTVPPRINLIAEIEAVNDAGRCQADLTLEPATAEDESGIASLTYQRSDTLDLEDPYPVGTTVITWKAVDNAGNEASAIQTITVLDREVPEIVLTGNSAEIWPPNYEYHKFTVDDLVALVRDNCTLMDKSKVLIEKVTSDESDVPVAGNAQHPNDILIGDGCREVRLRAERNGTGNGRVYNIHLMAGDESGNQEKATFKVFVPLNQGRDKVAIEGEVQHVVEGGCAGEALIASGFSSEDEKTEEKLPNGGFTTLVYPNPAKVDFNVFFYSPKVQEVRIVITDILANLKLDIDVMATEGKNDLNIDTSGLGNGLYMITLITGEKQEVKRLWIER